MPLPRRCFSRWTIISVVAIFIIVTVTVTCATYFTLAKKKHHAFDWTKVMNSRGDVIPDFSYAGYHNSAIILPSITAPNITVSFNNSVDVRPAIQAAIDSIAYSGGGSVILPAGKWSMTAGLNLSSNVVVAGSAGGTTVLTLSEKPSVPVFTLGSGNTAKPKYGFRSNITNYYVPIGSSSVDVVNSSGFAVDQLVYVSRIATESWITANGMNNLVRDDASQTWIPENKRFMTPNQISGVDGNNITLKIPLTDNIDLDYLRPELIVYTPPETNSEMGIRDLSIEVPGTCSGASLNDKTCNSAAVHFPSWTADSWVSGLTLKGFNKFFQIDQNASRITIQNSTMNRDKDISGSALPFDIMIQGSQVLVQDCEQVGISTARCFSVATGSLTPGPNAVLRHKTQSDSQTIYPHQRWAQGLLVEDTSVATYFVNRNIKGTGQGWSINGGVGWNINGYCEFESPPTGINWCIGCGETGSEPKGNATLLETGQRVEPQSLFQAQLQNRGVYRYGGEESKNNS